MLAVNRRSQDHSDPYRVACFHNPPGGGLGKHGARPAENPPASLDIVRLGTHIDRRRSRADALEKCSQFSAPLGKALPKPRAGNQVTGSQPLRRCELPICESRREHIEKE